MNVKYSLKHVFQEAISYCWFCYISMIDVCRHTSKVKPSKRDILCYTVAYLCTAHSQRNDRNTFKNKTTNTSIIKTKQLLTCHWNLLFIVIIWGWRSRWSTRPSRGRPGWAAIVLVIFLPVWKQMDSMT